MTIKESLGGDGGVVPGGVCDGVEYFETKKEGALEWGRKTPEGFWLIAALGPEWKLCVCFPLPVMLL